jgi:antitoxin component YwqK of YwqJK toxin-antitoxin module
MRILMILILITFMYGCSDKVEGGREIITVDTHRLDSIKRKSDTSWVKSYRNNEFVTAEYYVDRKDSIVTQLMKDSAGIIRQINSAKYDKVKLFFAEYYANGQLKANLPIDSAGKYHGTATLYYETGLKKSKGDYNHGFYTGEWKNFDDAGKLISTDVYDEKGQLVKTKKE